MFRRLSWRILLTVALALPARADAPRSVVWKDLLPKTPALVDPLAPLTMNQRIELRLVAAARKRQELGIGSDDNRGKLAEQNLTRKLEGQGLDVDALLARFAVHQAKVLERNRTADPGLAGVPVRLEGHLLPLVESDAPVTEFLLVPFVGACIHVPPPPPNQVVAIRTRAPIKSPGQFATVRVTGRMAVEAATKTLYLVDGTAAVPSAYAIDAESVEVTRD